MRIKHYSTKMLITLLPVVLIGTILLTYVSSTKSMETISTQVDATMRSELDSKVTGIKKKIDSVKMMAAIIAKQVGNSYTYTSLEDYEKHLSQVIYEEDIVLGSGIWFEPFVYDSTQKYVGPYIYKDGETVAVTMDYSNADYDYFNQEYYTSTVDAKEEALFTEAYYDETSGKVMSSCTYPIYNQQGKFIGCVSVDIDLTSIQELVNSIQIGKNGKAFLLNSAGIYLSSQDADKIMNKSITAEDNATLAKAGTQILATEEGRVNYKEDTEIYNVYFKNIPILNWKLAIRMPFSELNEPVKHLQKLLFLISGIINLLIIVVILLLVRNISKNLKTSKIVLQRRFR